MNWKCSCCGNTATTNNEKAKPTLGGCRVSKDKKHRWVKAK